MADDLAGSLSLDIDPFLQGLDTAAAAGQTFAAGAAGWSAVTLTLDTSAYEASLAGVQDGSASAAAAVDTLTQADESQLSASTASASAAQDDAAATADLTSQLQEQIGVLQAQVAAQQDSIARLQEHRQASEDAAGGGELLSNVLGRLGVPMGELGPASEKAAGGLGMITDASASSAAGLAAVGVAAGTVVVAAVAEATHSFIELSDAVRGTSEMTGLSEPTVQALRLGMSELGLDADSAQRSLLIFERNVGTMTTQMQQGVPPTGNMAKGLDQLGISAQSFIKLSPDQQLARIMDGFRAAGPEVNKTTVAFDLFGRSGATMIPILDQGSGALDQLKGKLHAAGSGVEASQTKVLAFHQSTADLQNTLMGLEVTVGSGVVPVLATLASTVDRDIAKFHEWGTELDKHPAIARALGLAWDYTKGAVEGAIPGFSQAAAVQNLLDDGNKKTSASTAALTKDQLDYQATLALGFANETAAAAGSQTLSLRTGEQSAAVEKLSTVLLASQQSTAAATAFQDQWARALKDGALEGSAYDDVIAGLNDKLKNTDPFTKAAAQSQLELDQIVKALGPDAAAAAVGIDRANQEEAKLAPILREVSAELRTTGDQGKTFNKELATDAAVSSQAFADHYGTAAQAVAEHFQSAATGAVKAWQDSNAQVLADQFALEGAITSGASDAEQQRLKIQLDADKQRQQSSLDTANAAIKDEQAYLTAVQSSAQQQISMQATVFDAKLKLSHETVDEQQTDLSTWLNAEIVTANDIAAIDDQLRQHLDDNTRAELNTRLQADIDRLASEKEYAREAEATAAANVKDTKLQTSELNLATTAVKDQTTAVTDLNQVKAAGLELDKAGVELSKDVVEKGALVTQSQLDGLHAVTEAKRTSALADLSAAESAQQNWLTVAESIDTATGASTKFSQAQIDGAKAAFTSTQEDLKAGQASFTAALSAEQKAQGSFDQQLDASLKARKQGETDYSASLTENGKLIGELASDTAIVQGSMGAGWQAVAVSGDAAARGAIQSWRNADAQVLADDQALKGQLSKEDRALLDAQRADDVARAQSARTAAESAVAAQKAWTDAVVKDANLVKQLAPQMATLWAESWEVGSGRARTAILNIGSALIAVEVGGGTVARNLAVGMSSAAQDSYDAWNTASQNTLAAEHALVLAVGPEEQARLATVVAADQGIQDSAYNTLQERVSDEQAFLQTVQQASRDIITEDGAVFDLQRSIRRETQTERNAGLDYWLKAEITVHQDIIDLENELLVTTDKVEIARLKAAIQNDQLRLASYQETAREIVQTAQDADEAIRNNTELAIRKIEPIQLPKLDLPQAPTLPTLPQLPPAPQLPTLPTLPTGGGLSAGGGTGAGSGLTAPTSPIQIAAQATVENLMIKNAGIATLHVKDIVYDGGGSDAVSTFPVPPSLAVASPAAGFGGGGGGPVTVNNFNANFSGASFNGTQQQTEATMRKLVSDMLTRGAVLSARRTT